MFLVSPEDMDPQSGLASLQKLMPSLKKPYIDASSVPCAHTATQAEYQVFPTAFVWNSNSKSLADLH